MNEVLFLKTCILIGGMLTFTAVGAKINKEFETKTECYITFFGLLGFMILVFCHRTEFPMNLFCLGMVSIFMGWALGPAIKGSGETYMFRKYLQKFGIRSKTERIYKWYSDRSTLNVYYYHEDNPEKKIERNSPQILRMREEFKNELCKETLKTISQKWKNVVFVTMLSTALCVYLTASFVWFSKVDYGFLKGALVLFLIIFLIIRIQKIFYPNASIYFYPLKFISIFHLMLLLVYDFNRLEKLVAKGDESWSTAVNIALSLYMDIIFIFMFYLESFANES
jgi:hypothetical protein